MKFVLKDPNDNTHVKYSLVDIPEPYKALADEYRHHLLEAASHADDHLVELILEGKDVPEEVLLRRIRAGTLGGKLTPVYCGSSKNFHGIQLLLDAVIDFLPSPMDRGGVQGIVPKSKEKAQRQARRQRAVLLPGVQDRSPSRPATWCSCASTPANCIPRTRC